MNWYYAHEGQQVGPISDEEFQALRAAGTVTDQTLVWREGMTNWLPLEELLRPAPPLPVSPTAPTAEMKFATAAVVCTGCGKPFSVDEVVRLGDGFVCAACKPVAIQRMREGVAATDAEDIRNEHIKHEASVKSVGVLYLIGAAFAIFGGGTVMVLTLWARLRNSGGASEWLNIELVALALLGIGGLQLVTGIALRRLKPWSRIVAGVFSGIGLLGFPVGTLINAYILYLLFSRKGGTVFSEDYQAVIAQTPHVKYRTSIVVWIFLGLLLLLIGFAIAAAVFRPGPQP